MEKIKVLLAVIIVLVGLGKSCKDKKAPAAPRLTVDCSSQQRSSATNGAVVCGRTAVPATQLAAIDEELRALSTDVDKLNYSKGRLPSDYVVFVYEGCQLSPESHTRSFLVDGGPAPPLGYDGTIYDQWNPKGKGVADGVSRIFASEMVIANGFGQLSNGYIVCRPPAVDQEFRNAVRFGPEHLLFYWNDRGKFEATKIHQSGGHPLIPRSNQGFAAARGLPSDVVDYVVLPKGAYEISGDGKIIVK